MKLSSRLLISPTAFKGTLDPLSAARIILREAKTFWPVRQIRLLPLADGGDGSLQVLTGPYKVKTRTSKVRGPLGDPVKAKWGIVQEMKPNLPAPVAIIEMARASGLALLDRPNRILEATTYGTGQLISAALDAGCRSILICVGGTATADGGAGALEALGLKYYDRQGNPLSSKPLDLIELRHIDWSRFDKRLTRANILVICDVTNPLLGRQGSARIFGPQKGASPQEVQFLERFLKRWASFSPRRTKDHPGAGAAGALAFGLSGFAGAKLVRGTDFIMKAIDWKSAAEAATTIITGEGRVDKTSFSGKVVGEIVRNAPQKTILVVCGETTLSNEFLRRKGISRAAIMGRAGLAAPVRQLALSARDLLKLYRPL